ncbi:capsule assembly Wzi family protein [Deltaproteobacteria bacterium TL4]
MVASPYVRVFITILYFFLSLNVSRAEIIFSDLDFWYFEHLENKELQGGEGIQLNTKPLVIHRWKKNQETPTTEFFLESVELEYSQSSFMPIVQKREGIWITKGNNGLVSTDFGMISKYLSIYIEPLYAYHENQSLEDHPEGNQQPITKGSYRYPSLAETYSEAMIHSGYLILHASNWYLFLGKDNLRFGAGKHDTLHLSNSAEPFPMLRIGTIEPWDTRLGLFSFISYLGEMEENRTIPRAKFSGWRLDWSTQKRVEFGVSRSWFVGGEGQKEEFTHVVSDLYTELFKPRSGSERDGDLRNQQLVLDMRIKIPEIKTVLYGEFGREDHEHNLKNLRKSWNHSQAHILGIKSLGWVPHFFWIFERANDVQPSENIATRGNVLWYTHHEYQSGWTYEGIGLGHHMGADSQDTFFALGIEKRLYSLLLYHDAESHGINSNLQENKIEVGIQGFWQISSHTKLNFEIQQQEYDNFALIPKKQLSSLSFAIGMKYQL